MHVHTHSFYHDLSFLSTQQLKTKQKQNYKWKSKNDPFKNPTKLRKIKYFDKKKNNDFTKNYQLKFLSKNVSK